MVYVKRKDAWIIEGKTKQDGKWTHENVHGGMKESGEKRQKKRSAQREGGDGEREAERGKYGKNDVNLNVPFSLWLVCLLM